MKKIIDDHFKQDRPCESEMISVVEISVKDIDIPSWTDNLCKFTLEILNLLNKKNWELSILLCSDKIIQELNYTYRNKNEPTDVLSFSQMSNQELPPSPVSSKNLMDKHTFHTFLAQPENSTIIAGDIVISLDTLYTQAKVFSVTPNEELKRLVIHAILHLDGMNHNYEESEIDKKPKEEIFVIQDKLLNQATGDIIV